MTRNRISWFLFQWIFVCILCNGMKIILASKQSVPSYIYRRGADIHFAVLTGVHTSHLSGECTSNLRRNAFYNIQVIRMVVDAINQNNHILPNVTLGFVVKDTCMNRELALRQVVEGVHPLWSPDQTPAKLQKSWPVFAAFGCEDSQCAASVSGFLQINQLPLLSVKATADTLGNKHLHPYFARLLPGARHFGELIARFIAHLGWEYAAIVYENGALERDVLSGFDTIARTHNVCSPVRQVISTSLRDRELREIVRNTVVRLRQGNVIVMVLGPHTTTAFLRQLEALDKRQRYILILADPLYRPVEQRTHQYKRLSILDGAITFNMVRHRSRFLHQFSKLTYQDIKDTPWAKEYMKAAFKCQWWHRPSKLAHRKRRSCRRYQDTPFAKSGRVGGRIMATEPTDFLTESGAQILAAALHQVILNNCPRYFLTKDSLMLSNCLRGQDIYEEMVRGQYRLKDEQDLPVDIHFYANGDIATGSTTITQTWVHPFALTNVGTFYKQSGRLELQKQLLRWPAGLALYPERNGVPKSQCSASCAPGYFRLVETTCCWRCSMCKPNEVVVSDRSRCRACPTLMWPNMTHRLSCHMLIPSQTSSAGVFVVSSTVATVCVSLCVVLFALLLYRRRTKVVWTCQLPLYLGLLSGVLLLSVQTFLFLAPASNILCVFRQLVFPLNFSFISACILVRCLRILAVFRMNANRPTGLDRSCIGSRSQAGMVIALLFAQLAISLFVLWTFSMPRARLVMPKPQEPFVLRVCEASELAVHLPAAYSAFLALLGVGLAWPVRHLPDNCRESPRLLLCSGCTLTLWALFFPLCHLLAGHSHRSLLHLLLLHVGALLHLACLYLPTCWVISRSRDTVEASAWPSNFQLIGRDNGTLETRDNDTVMGDSQT